MLTMCGIKPGDELTTLFSPPGFRHGHRTDLAIRRSRSTSGSPTMACSLLVVDDDDVGSEVASFCLEVLDGCEPRPMDDAGADLSTPVALAHVRSESFGHGSLGRDSLRPLRELLEFVVAELGRS